MLRDAGELKLMSLATPTEKTTAGLVSFPIAITKDDRSTITANPF
jgi:hypothetical protein